MESDDKSFYVTQDSFRKDVDVDESDFDPDFLEWVNECKRKTKAERACSSTRKITPVSDEDLKRRREEKTSQKTKSNTAWCLRTLNEWAKKKNAMSSSLCINEGYQFVNLDLLETDEEELCYWFSKFIVEVRQKKNPGMPYHYASSV